MSLERIGRACAVLLLAGIGLALSQAASPTTAAASTAKKPSPPALLWKVYPLRQVPTPRDEVTITRALRLLDERMAAGQARGPARSPTVVVLLFLVALVLGIAGLPRAAFPDPSVAHFVARWRVELAMVGGAVFLAVIALILK